MRCPSNGEGRKKEKEGNLLSSSSSFFEFVTCDNWEKGGKGSFLSACLTSEIEKKGKKEEKIGFGES